MAQKISDLKTRLAEALQLRDKKAIDLHKDLKIPRSALSQYLSGKTTNMDSSRLADIAQYLVVDETWLMGYDVAINHKASITASAHKAADIAKDEDLAEMIDMYLALPEDKKKTVKQMVADYYKAFANG